MNRAARDVVAEAILDYAQGRIRSADFDDRIDNVWGKDFDDPALDAAFMYLWGTCDDFTDKPERWSAHQWAIARRWYAFLKSDLPYLEPLKRGHRWIPFIQTTVYGPSWPFAIQRDWLEYRHLALDAGLEPRPLLVKAMLRLYRRSGFGLR